MASEDPEAGHWTRQWQLRGAFARAARHGQATAAPKRPADGARPFVTAAALSLAATNAAAAPAH